MICRIGHRDDPAHPGADQREVPKCDPVDKGREVTCLICVMVCASRPPAVAMTTQIDSEDVKSILELPRERVKRLRRRRIPVHTYHYRHPGFAPFEVM